MYVESGLGGYRARRGLAGGQMVNGVYVTDTPITTETVYGSGAQSTYTDYSGESIAPAGGGSSLTSWLNQNSTMVAVGAGVFVLALLFARSGR